MRLGEDQSSADVQCSLVLDLALATVQVVTVEVARDGETIIGCWSQDQFLITVRVEPGCGQVKFVMVIVTVVERYVDGGTEESGGWENSILSDLGDFNGDLIRTVVRALVGDHVTFEMSSDTDRQIAVVFVATVATVLDSVADQQSSDTLRIRSAALELPLAAS